MQKPYLRYRIVPMDSSLLVFKAIDVLLDKAENSVEYPLVTTEEVSYDSRFLRTKADIKYVGEKGKLRPVIFYIPGGGFVAGDKQHRREITGFFASKGYAVFCANLRTAPEFPFPNPLEDLVTALNFLYDNSNEYGFDTDNVIFAGDSSGGYYASYAVALATHPTLREELNLPELKVKPRALIFLSGVVDLIKMVKLRDPLMIARNTGRHFLNYKLKWGATNAKSHEFYKYLSPANFVTENWCPTFLSYSKKDLFCGGQGEILDEKLTQFAIEERKHVATRLLDNHCYILFSKKKKAREAQDEMAQFLIKFRQ